MLGCRSEIDAYGYRWWGVRVDSSEVIETPRGQMKRFCESEGWGSYDGSSASSTGLLNRRTCRVQGIQQHPRQVAWRELPIVCGRGRQAVVLRLHGNLGGAGGNVL